MNKQGAQNYVIDRAISERLELRAILATAYLKLEEVEARIYRLKNPRPSNPIVPDIWKQARAFR